jgi:hypothetical protein
MITIRHPRLSTRIEQAAPRQLGRRSSRNEQARQDKISHQLDL